MKPNLFEGNDGSGSDGSGNNIVINQNIHYRLRVSVKLSFFMGIIKSRKIAIIFSKKKMCMAYFYSYTCVKIYSIQQQQLSLSALNMFSALVRCITERRSNEVYTNSTIKCAYTQLHGFNQGTKEYNRGFFSFLSYSLLHYISHNIIDLKIVIGKLQLQSSFAHTIAKCTVCKRTK